MKINGVGNRSKNTCEEIKKNGPTKKNELQHDKTSNNIKGNHVFMKRSFSNRNNEQTLALRSN